MTLTFAILGDSIAYGQGASRSSDTVGSRLARELSAAGIENELRVFAVPGARSQALAAQVLQAERWAARLAVVIIGANDLTHFVPPATAAAQLGESVSALRASGALVVVSPAPDLGVVPWVPPQMRLMVSAASDTLRRVQTSAAIAAGATVVDVDAETVARFGTDVSMFSADRFHPSSEGYALIARSLAPAVLTAAREILRKPGESRW